MDCSAGIALIIVALQGFLSRGFSPGVPMYHDFYSFAKPRKELLETLTCQRLHDDEAKIIIIDLVHIPLHTCHCCKSRVDS
jgi:hypothetical protein